MTIKKTSVSSISIMLIDSLSKLINDSEFIDRHKHNTKDFIRDRTLTFKVVVLFLLSNLKESVQSELGNFFAKIERSDVKIQKVSNSAFTQARAKLKHSVFIEMNTVQTDLFYNTISYKTWNGFRLIAIDGSTLQLPYTVKIHEEFGPVKINQTNVKKAMARISEAYDPLNNVIIDASISPFHVSEFQMFEKHVEKLNEKDLVIMDRNYTGFWVYKLLISRKMDFCIRVQANGNTKFINEFIASGQTESIVDVKCTTPNSKQKCKELEIDTSDIKCRLIRIELENKQIEVLITSLVDIYKYPYECFNELYHLRWGVEESYKILKCRIWIDNFSGKTVKAIHQDFFAKIFLANLTAILAFEANQEIKQKKENCKYEYQINWNNALQNMKETGFLLFIRQSFTKLLEQLHLLFQTNPIAIIPDRKFARPKDIRRQSRSIAYK